MSNIKKSLKGKLSEDKLRLLKKEIVESLSCDRQRLICLFPFTGSISMRLDLIPVRDKRCRTACTDGKSVYFDCDFYTKLNNNERLFVLAHEIWHCVMLHLVRKQSRIQEIFNIASDMEVNSLLVESKNATNDSGNELVPPKSLCFPPNNLKGKSAEVIYEWLIKQAKKNSKKSNSSSNADSSNGSDSSDSNSDSNSSSKSCKSSNGRKQDKNANDSSDKGLTGQFDKHTYSDDNGDDDDVNEEITDQWGEVGYDEDFTPSVSEDIAEKIREATIAAAQQYEREHGKLPANIEQIVKKITKPEIKWQEILQQFVNQCYGGKRQWLPPARRHIWHEAYFQSRRNERIKGIVAIDTSGSCINDLPKFFGELKGLIDSFGSYELTVIQADAAVDHVETYDDVNNPLAIEDASQIKVFGGGGTDYGPVFKYVEKNRIIPDFLIYIGDGYADMSYKKLPTYPVLWLITKDGSFDFCKWGKKIRFKESSYDY